MNWHLVIFYSVAPDSHRLGISNVPHALQCYGKYLTRCISLLITYELMKGTGMIPELSVQESWAVTDWAIVVTSMVT